LFPGVPDRETCPELDIWPHVRGPEDPCTRPGLDYSSGVRAFRPRGDGVIDTTVIDTLKIAFEIAEAALEKQAIDPVLIHVEDYVSYADYVLIVTANSTPQVDAIADHCAATGKKRGHRALSVEGSVGGNHDWVLVDFGDVVLHVFKGDARHRYDLEGLWSDAAQVEIPGVERPVPSKYVASS